MDTAYTDLPKHLQAVRHLMAGCLEGTNLAKLFPGKTTIMASGKMLRSQLVLYMGRANNIPEETLIHSAAAVEMIHGASLLHDDVIDGGILRRGVPTFWKKYGINGAILFGDFLVFEGLNFLVKVNRADLLQELIDMSKLVCRSEVEQELILRGTPGTWQECEQIARAKTGSLFAFAAVATATDEPGQTDALREAGFIVGTAYQLVDDILDCSGDEALSGKTLGRDEERGKTTAITATENAPEDPIAYIQSLLQASLNQLEPWPEFQQCWNDFLNVTMKPVLNKHLSAGQPAS